MTKPEVQKKQQPVRQCSFLKPTQLHATHTHNHQSNLLVVLSTIINVNYQLLHNQQFGLVPQ
jgi:hypothetical protein